MRHVWILILLTGIIFSGCKSSSSSATQTGNWYNIAVAEGVEIYVDTLSISRYENTVSGREKRIFVSTESKAKYVAKIKNEYSKMGKPEKADKWNSFSYCIYNCLYDCTNKRFRILSVEDYDTNGKLIIKSTPPKNLIKWLNVDSETVGDYTFFFVCDYGI